MLDEAMTRLIPGPVEANDHRPPGERISAIIDSWLDLLKKEYSDLTPLLMDMFDYDSETQKFKIRPNLKFRTNIDIKLRIRYYLYSFLRRMEIEKKNPTFDEIIFNIMPLLKNGKTPEHQTILSVLKDIGEHIGEDKWQLKNEQQLNLFGI